MSSSEAEERPMSDTVQVETRLPIRVRRTIDGNGEISAVMLVYCESRRRSISLDDCTDCDQCEAVHIDPLESDSWLVCRRGSGYPAAAELEEAGGDGIPVASIMSPRVICVAPETPTSVVRELLLERGVTGAPVVDGG